MTIQIRTGDVFVPGKEPIYTYNPRDELNLESSLNDYLDDGGSILALLGPTKTGKTVLLDRVLTEPIWIDGQDIKSTDDLWELVGSKIEARVDTDIVEQSSSGTSVSAKATVLVAEGSGEYSDSESQTFGSRYVSAIAPVVKRELSNGGRTLVIDDFHFIDRGVQQEIVRALKPLVFKNLRVVFASITYRRNDVANAVEDMDGRVTPLETSAWSESELQFIAAKGFEKLNVVDQDQSFGVKLAEMSFGSPHIMQQLCRELVRSENGIRVAAKKKTVLHAPESWERFFQAQVSDGSKRWFTKLLRGPQEKGQKRATWALKNSDTRLDTYGLALKAIAESLPRLEVTRDEIRTRIDRAVSGKAPESHQITRTLQYMSRIAATRLNEEQVKEEDLESPISEFLGVQPVLEFIEDGPASAVHIADPFFAYYLKWGSESHLTS